MAIETTIPFSGFYESEHDGNLDAALDQMVQDDSGESLLKEGEAETLYWAVNWGKAHNAYAKLYTEAFQDYFNENTEVRIEFKYEVMQSPKEYNFTTDRIFCKVSARRVREVYALCDKRTLNKYIEKRFTSYDGFSSFYANSLEAWLEIPVSKWDHNQVGTLLESYLSEFVNMRELSWRVMEDWNCSGEFDNIVYDAMNEEGRAIVKRVSDERQAAEEAYAAQYRLSL